jgi:phage tail-like protein
MPNGQEAAAPAATTAAQPGVAVDPFRAYQFKVIIEGTTEAHFTECSGFGIRVHPIRYREAGTQQVVRAVPGPVDYGTVSLRYGLTASPELWAWFMTAVEGRVERKNMSIAMLNSTGETEEMRWNLINAWPTEWWGAPLDALSQVVAIESLRIVFETLQRA